MSPKMVTTVTKKEMQSQPDAGPRVLVQPSAGPPASHELREGAAPRLKGHLGVRVLDKLSGTTSALARE